MFTHRVKCAASQHGTLLSCGRAWVVDRRQETSQGTRCSLSDPWFNHSWQRWNLRASSAYESITRLSALPIPSLCLRTQPSDWRPSSQAGSRRGREGTQESLKVPPQGCFSPQKGSHVHHHPCSASTTSVLESFLLLRRVLE